MGKIKITGTAKREVAADIMNIRMAVYAKGKTTEHAIVAGKESVERLLQLLMELGIDISKIEMQDEDISDATRYNDDKVEYKYSKRLNFKTALNLKLLEAIGNGIAEKKITAVYSENFERSDEKTIEKEVVCEALEDSREQAFALAQVLGQTVKGVEEISGDEYGTCAKYSEHEISCAYALGGGSLAEELAPHTIEIEKKIDVIWLVE